MISPIWLNDCKDIMLIGYLMLGVCPFQLMLHSIILVIWRKNHPKIKFQYENSQGELLDYYLTVTDPNYPNDERLPQGVAPEVYLIVSLGEVYEEDGEVYLLVAKVITDII